MEYEAHLLSAELHLLIHPEYGEVGAGNVNFDATLQLIDGGSVFVPRSATNDAEGNYIIEGYGVDPDVVDGLEFERLLSASGPTSGAATLTTRFSWSFGRATMRPRNW